MTRLDHSLVLTLLAAGAVPGAHAGNQLWEHSVKLQAPHPVEHFAVDAAGYAVRDNATQEALTKRYVGMLPQEGPGKSKLWPDKTISYCYSTQESKDRLMNYIDSATRMWEDAKLHGDVYKYREVAKPGSDCVNNKQRSKMLVISFNNEGKLATTLGYQSLDEADPEYKGPSMTLSDRLDIGMLDITSNIAHEIGHAWGLAHEHQNPHFWAPNAGYGSLTASPFSFETFNCKALKDYAEVYARVSHTHPNDVPNLCMSRRFAATHNFSAAEWLPYREEMHFEVTGRNVGYVSVDWKSIMIYPSGAGGIGTAAPPAAGQPLGANDRRQNVLMRRDNQKIEPNFKPSERDVEGIRGMYEDYNFPEGLPVLLTDKKSKWHDKFLKNFKKDKCKE